MSDMKAYLAAKYMSGAKAEAILSRSGGDSSTKPKKKKRKVDVYTSEASGSKIGASRSGIGIVDEDARWGGGDDMEDGEEDTPMIAQERKTFQPASSSNWSTLNSMSSLPLAGHASGSRSPSSRYDRERSGSPSEPPPAPAPVKKKGGLMTAAQIAEENAALEAARARAAAEARAAGTEQDERVRVEREKKEKETVYRTAQGQIIDIKAEKAAEKRRLREEAEKEAERMEWGKGLVQRSEREERRKKEEEMKGKGVARYANDKDLNDDLKSTDRWNDPAAAFLTKKRSKGPQKPRYTGPAAPPNRFGIPPGYRWDGVDRSTGFEAKMFQRQNDQRRRQVEANLWSTEDM